MRKIMLKAAWLFTDLLALPLAYFCYAFIASAIPVNASHVQPETGITIYIHSNGFHTDLILPVEETTTQTNWLELFDDSLLQRKHRNAKWMAAGWGDEGFYLDSYNNTFPGFGTCCNALLVPSPSLLHVAFYEHGFSRTARCRPVKLRTNEYALFCKFIRQTFVCNAQGRAHPISSPGYWEYDYFFRANGSYHLFQTCNDWTNDCLKSSGLKAPLKAPFDRFVLQYY
ncbi:MAG: DUF2459 domain-containing protein [Bacteroidetes bacterium]|nr:DUF2459 domain-containing protein [Bacteroidota bacterium]